MRKEKDVAMNEEEFYKMCDIVEYFKNITHGWYPTVEEMKAYDVPGNIIKYLPILIYFSSDPLKNDMGDEREEYDETVKYCKNLVSKVTLVS